MSSLVKTEAIVLKSIKYRETSKIITFYTLDFGKLKGLAKGARRGKKGIGAIIEPMSHVSLVLYKKEKREIQLVSECDLIKPFSSIRENLEKMLVGMSIIELVNLLTTEGDKNLQFFKMTSTSLSTLDRIDRNFYNILYGFEIQLVSIMGFKPDFNLCVVCGKNIVPYSDNGLLVEFHIDKGGALCNSCKSRFRGGFKLSVRAFQLLKCLGALKYFEGIQNIGMDNKLKDEIDQFLWSYLCYHFGGLRKLKSRTVLSKVLQLP